MWHNLERKKLRILFRTSGGRAIGKELGLGHLYRCLNLAETLKKNELFFLVEDYGGIRKVLDKYCIGNVFFLRKNTELRADISKTISIVKEKKIDVLIVDIYNVRHQYLRSLKQYTKVVFLSDLHRIDFPAHLVVNGFVGYRNRIVKNKYGARCVLGPRFQILNEGFAKKNHVRKTYKLLCTFGGFDEYNIVKIVIEQLLKLPNRIKTRVILGPSTPKSMELFKLCRRYGKDLSLVKHTDNMKKEICSSEFGMCSGGISSYEFASQGIRFAIICQVKHQLITAMEWQRKHVAINLGLIHDRNTKQKVVQLLSELTENRLPYRKSRKSYVDGLGSIRVVREILKLKNIGVT